MKGKILLALITVLVFGLGSAKAQLPPKVVQVSGVVLISDSLFPAGFVAIYRAKDRRGTYSGRDGYFTLPVMVGDTLFFSSIGLKDSYFVIPADSKDNQLSMVQVMSLESYMLPTAYILPYPSRTRLRAEILSLDLPGDEYVSFHREGNDIVNYDGMVDFSAQSYRSASSQIQNRYTNGFYSGGNLLSKDAWGNFMRSLKSGDLDSQQ
jgi:hypothetical protein